MQQARCMMSIYPADLSRRLQINSHDYDSNTPSETSHCDVSERPSIRDLYVTSRDGLLSVGIIALWNEDLLVLMQ